MAGKAGGSENCTLRSRKQPNCSSVTAGNPLIGVGLMECWKKPEYEQLSKKTMIRTLLVLQLALYKSPIGYSTDLFFSEKTCKPRGVWEYFQIVITQIPWRYLIYN